MKGILPLMSALAVMFGSLAAVHAIANCPGTIMANYSTGDDIQVTSNTDCVTIGANSLTVNCNNHKILCNNAGGCNAGVNVPNGYSSTLVKNCWILNGTGDWYYGVLNGATSGVASTTTVQHVTTDNTTVSVYNPYSVNHSIFKDTTNCLLSNVSDKNGTIQENYCNASGDGIVIIGNDTQVPTITKNYIRTPSTSLAVNVDNHGVDVEYNIFDGGSIDSVGGVTYSAFNICDDLALNHCTEPAENTSTGQPDFVMPLNFTP